MPSITAVPFLTKDSLTKERSETRVGYRRRAIPPRPKGRGFSHKIDETWCLYNGHLVDDELNALWNHFAMGVRILVITDSCHSGTVSRGRQRSRAMPLAVALATYRVRRDFYLRIMQHCKNQPAPVASVRLLSACSDQETTADGDKNGYFTSALKQVWADGTFVGDYNHFYEQIYAKLYPGQSPEHSIIGSWDETYNQQRPFML